MSVKSIAKHKSHNLDSMLKQQYNTQKIGIYSINYESNTQLPNDNYSKCTQSNLKTFIYVFILLKSSKL